MRIPDSINIQDNTEALAKIVHKHKQTLHINICNEANRHLEDKSSSVFCLTEKEPSNAVK